MQQNEVGATGPERDAQTLEFLLQASTAFSNFANVSIDITPIAQGIGQTCQRDCINAIRRRDLAKVCHCTFAAHQKAGTQSSETVGLGESAGDEKIRVVPP